MAVTIIQNRLSSYQLHSKQEELNALKEIYQEIALSGLARANFFKNAAFQGVTCLRILHQLRRFSEDLDFILVHPEEKFEWQPYLTSIETEFKSFGVHLKTRARKSAEGAIQTAFLKQDSFGQILELNYPRLPSDQQVITLKLEIDIHPPAGSTFETKFLTYPYPFSVVAQDLPTLFASKCHDLLCRSFLKGRDWFDFLWYLSAAIPINTLHLQCALKQVGPYAEEDFSLNKKWLVQAFQKKIASLDWRAARLDVESFLNREDKKFVENWSEALFQSQLKKIVLQ